MNPLRRTVTAVLLAAGIAASGAVFGATVAHAQTSADEQFAAAVAKMGIPLGEGTDPAKLGKGICDMLTQGLTGAANPVPVVRGVVNALAGQGLTHEQAAGLMKASVVVYCPQWGRLTGR